MPATTARVERVFPFALEQRAADDAGPPRIVGHAAVFSRLSENLGGFREVLEPGSFTKTLADRSVDVRALFNHDPNYVLGRYRDDSGSTLRLREDRARGLHVEITPPDTQTIRDLVLVPMARGDVDQMSFAFRPIVSDKPRPQTDDERTATGDDLPVIARREVRLYDVSVVTFPAYPQTDAAVRSALASVGIEYDGLAAVIDRHARRLSLSEADVSLISGTLSVLRGLLPEEPVPVPADGGLHSEAALPEPNPAIEPRISLEVLRQRLSLAELVTV